MPKEYQYIMTNIRQCRILRKMTQEELAESAGLSVSYIAQLESNRKSIGFKSLSKIAYALSVSMAELLETDEKVFKREKDDVDIALEALLADCGKEEKRIMYEMVRQLKKSMRDSTYI